MSIHVNTENVTDATVQVHIAFEDAASGRYYRSNRRRNAQARNHAGLRTHEPVRIATGRNSAMHRSSRKHHRTKSLPQRSPSQPLALPAPKPKTPA